jgi:hypothetical protein
LARERWLAALNPDDLNDDDDGGGRAEHRFFSNRAIELSYGRLLTWCESNGVPLSQAAPCEQITPKLVRAFANDLLQLNATATVITRVTGLKVIATIIDPARDWSWIYKTASKIRPQHRPARLKRDRLIPIEQLQSLGFELLEMAKDAVNQVRSLNTHRMD